MYQALMAAQMKECDTYMIEDIGIPSAVLMERASLAVAEDVLSYADHKEIPAGKLRVLSVCGSGNNGGDGVAAARILYLKGITASLYLAGNPDHQSAEMTRQLEIASKIGIKALKSPDFSSYDVIIDAIFGIGLNREVGGSYRKLIEKINRSGSYIISVDIPSGISADSGRVLGIAVRADRTVTMQAVKRGLLLYPGASYAGLTVRADIGIMTHDFPTAAYVPEEKDLSLLPQRDCSGNKGTFGKILVIAGSKNMSGASYFTSLAALRMGVGMVRILTPEENRCILQQMLPEAMLTTYSSETEAVSKIDGLLTWADVIACGPGLTTSVLAKNIVKTVLLKSALPLVLDADGLNCLAGNPDLLKGYRGTLIITPHIGEMSRLCGAQTERLKEDPTGYAKTFAHEYQLTCVLKDARTVTATPDGKVYINIYGNDGMATAGSGDVLTGIAAACLARGADPAKAGALAVLIHALAGDAAMKVKGRSGLLAQDLTDGIQQVLGENL